MLDEVKFKKVVIETLQISDNQFSWDLALNSVPSWDSMGHMNLIFAIEENFAMSFTSEEIPELKSLDKIRNTMTTKLPSK